MKKNVMAVVLTLVIIGAAIAGEIYVFKKSKQNVHPREEHGKNATPKENFSQSDTYNLVNDYIKQNISSLSPQKSVLGGSFHVTGITLIDPDSCVVSYEDGHVALNAEVDFRISSTRNVEITSFKIVQPEKKTGEENAAADFWETGSVIQKDGKWYLSYEAPGKPALSVELSFSDKSHCSKQYLDKSCTPSYWQPGARAEVTGTKDKEKILVDKFDITEDNADLENGNNSSPKQGNSNAKSLCQDQCGNGICDEMVCQGEGCPCAETTASCAKDCK